MQPQLRFAAARGEGRRIGIDEGLPHPRSFPRQVTKTHPAGNRSNSG
jgi:hypothetical protein